MNTQVDGMRPRPDGRERPLRVMHLLHTFGVGGMEVGITKLVNSLDESRIASSICSCRPGDSLKQRLRADIPLYEFNRREGNDPRLVAQLVRLFRAKRPDVIHTHRWATLLEGLIAARLAGVPHVVHGEHGTLETRRHNAFVQRTVWNRVDRVLSVSSRLAERMSRDIGFPLDRIQVIRNGVDLERFKPEQRREAREAFGFAPNQVVIGSVGRLVPVKDQATLLRALALLRTGGFSFTGLLAGAGPLHGELQSLAAALNLDNVTLLGNRNDVERVLGALDIFVLSSQSEGLSNTIQEAMATGLPVVATRVGGADELVEPDQTGYLIPSGDPRALAEKIANLITDPARRQRFAHAGWERARQHFGLDRMIGEYERMYLDLSRRTPDVVGYAQTNEA